MLAILVAFGAALFIWFHNGASTNTSEMACHVPESVAEVEEIAPTDFTEQVFEREIAANVELR